MGVSPCRRAIARDRQQTHGRVAHASARSCGSQSDHGDRGEPRTAPERVLVKIFRMRLAAVLRPVAKAASAFQDSRGGARLR
jgi:hypothetical protein